MCAPTSAHPDGDTLECGSLPRPMNNPHPSWKQSPWSHRPDTLHRHLLSTSASPVFTYRMLLSLQGTPSSVLVPSPLSLREGSNSTPPHPPTCQGRKGTENRTQLRVPLSNSYRTLPNPILKKRLSRPPGPRHCTHRVFLEQKPFTNQEN